MNQFGNIEEQLKKCSKVWLIANDFDYILNNIWCIYSFDKGKKKWKEIRFQIPEPFKSDIDIEMGHVSLGHGIDQARQSVKYEMNKYIDYLLNNVMK